MKLIQDGEADNLNRNEGAATVSPRRSFPQFLYAAHFDNYLLIKRNSRMFSGMENACRQFNHQCSIICL